MSGMQRIHEYDFYYVEWLHAGKWTGETIMMQKGTPPEPYCDARMEGEWTHGTSGVKTKATAYILMKLEPARGANGLSK